MPTSWELLRGALDLGLLLVGILIKLEIANLRVWVLQNFVSKGDFDERHRGKR
jgi:hypothetical protein